MSDQTQTQGTESSHGVSLREAFAVWLRIALLSFGEPAEQIALMHKILIEEKRWISETRFLHALNYCMLLPGPGAQQLATYIGWLMHRAAGGLPPLAAGVLGGLLTVWTTFTPCFMWIFVGAPYIEALRGAKALNGALSAITAAVVGVILNLAAWFGLHFLFHRTTPVERFGLSFDAPVLSSLDPWAAALAIGAAVAVLRFRIGLLPTLGSCAAAGIILHASGLPIAAR
jgi:chromate transporter